MNGQQNFSDFAIGGAVRPCIRGTQRKRYSAPAMRRKRMQRRSLRPANEPSPQTSACIRPEFEVAVERKFNGVGSSDDRPFFQPNAVLNAVQIQHGVPTVGSLPQLTLVQVAEIQADVRVRCHKSRRPYRDYRRQNLRCPENGLFQERSIGISYEKPTPNVAGIRRSNFGLMMGSSDDPFGTRRYGAGIPMQFRSFPLVRRDRSRCRLTISS
jgi:hypothetical protein